ncbi:VanZ family protein [Paenibacillus sp. JCM 10914]|uniref:VanZ family protein n=1 Tax=Paenibacillus sp. JCM 10914 TaxID=1236974 RepID=UPI0003CC40B1|nr:VanZ family protein [Paenibacillus sp. JCM 10914]GAE06542.1 hypothetical protein JCM10914_2707 [Paenibacillus sp. JCM 10914]
MFQGKSRKVMIVLLGLYTTLTLFFLFLGFDRASTNQDQGLRYNFMLEAIPLHFPMGKDFQIWFFDLGNFLAFVPFGVLIPLLYRCSFIRFISFFILGITIVESLQMISRLGAFDINDIIINSLGAAVGYGSQRLVTRHRNTWKGLIRIVLTAVVLSTGTIVAVGGINHYLNNVDGESVALNELAIKVGAVQWDESLSAFTVGDTKVEPQINLYSKENTKNNEFSYLLNGKYDKISGYVAILGYPDDTAGNQNNEISFIADGAEIYSISLGGEPQPDPFKFSLKGVTELTIKVLDNGPHPNTNLVMWDVNLIELNTGQRILHMISSPFR